MDSWQQLYLRCKNPEAVAEVLEACGAVAVTLMDAADNPVLEPAPGATPLWPQTKVVGLFAAELPRDEIEARLERGADEWILSSHWDAVPERIWERVWLEHFVPLEFGQRLRVAAHDHQIPSDGRVTVRLDPGLAFGTGTHPSTALCLRWLGEQDTLPARVLDYGCGSGILGLAAKMLGAASVTACDIDPQAEQATVANALANGQELRVVTNENALAAQYELVLANILASTLIELAPAIAATVAQNGQLLLAGLLRDQITAVSAAYPQFSWDQRTEADWALLVGRRNLCD